MKKAAPFAAFLLLTLGTAPAEAAKFYKWTDEQGVTHYSADPPPETIKASEVKVKGSRADRAREAATAAASAPAAGKGPAAASAGKPAAPKAEEKKAEAKNPEQYAERCKGLRGNLQSMEQHAQVKETDDKGEVRVLTNEEKAARLDETQRQIKAFCE